MNPVSLTVLLFSHSVVSDCLQPHGLQYTRLPCPSPSPRVCSNSLPLTQWCYPTILSSVVPFSFCPQFFPASGSFLMSQLFASGGQSIGALASVSVLQMNIQDWFPLGLTGLIAWQSKRLSRVYSWVYIKIIESRGWNRHLYTCVHSSIIHSSQKVEMTQVSIHRWVDKQNTVYANIRIWPNF